MDKIIYPHTIANTSFFIEEKSWWTTALETSKCVYTLSTLTETWQLKTFIDI